jgi:hypothetical protein
MYLILPQNYALISDHDAGQFAGNLSSEAISNRWEESPKPGHRRLES